MTDRERILAMVEDGRINQQEADRLLAVLADIDEVDHSLRRVDEEAQTTSRSVDEPDPAPDERPDDRAASGAAASVGAAVADKVARAVDRAVRNGVSATDSRADPVEHPTDLRWLRVNMLAGDLDIGVDDSLDEPVVENDEGDYRLERDGDDYLLSQFAGKQGEGWLDRLVGGFQRSDLNLKIPSRFGVHLDMKAGDITIGEVAYLRGHLLAGDLSARAHGVDLTMSAGDLDLELRPTRGRHRLAVSAGDVKITLLDGSSVRVDGRVSIGDSSLPDGFERHRRGIGASFSGTVGEGDADLELRLSTGDLKVSTPKASTQKASTQDE